MKIICEKKELSRLLSTVSKAVSIRAVSPIMECVLFDAVEDHIELYGTDTVLSIKGEAPAQVLEEGGVAVSARLFSDIVNKYPDGELELYTNDEKMLFIKCGSSKAQLKYMDPSGYPPFPVAADEPYSSVGMSEKLLRDMVTQTIFSSAVNEDKPILTGVLFETTELGLSMVAMDGYRLAIRKHDAPAARKEVQRVLPGKSLRELSRILSDSEDAVSVDFVPTGVSVKCSGVRLFTRVLEEDYVKYRNILPTDHKTRVRADTKTLLSAIERASILSREESNNLIKLNISEDVMVVTSNSELGNAREDVAVYCEGRELTIAFNAKYLTDVLKNIDDEELLLDFNTNISPCVISPVSGDAFMYLILPVQIRS